MNLDEKIKKYFELKEEIEKLESQKEELSNSIKTMIAIFPEQSYTTPEGYSAKVVTKTNYKYVDETAILNYLDKKKLTEMYVVRKLDTTKINKELKNHGLLFKDLKDYINENLVESLTIKLGEK